MHTARSAGRPRTTHPNAGAGCIRSALADKPFTRVRHRSDERVLCRCRHSSTVTRYAYARRRARRSPGELGCANCDQHGDGHAGLPDGPTFRADDTHRYSLPSDSSSSSQHRRLILGQYVTGYTSRDDYGEPSNRQAFSGHVHSQLAVRRRAPDAPNPAPSLLRQRWHGPTTTRRTGGGHRTRCNRTRSSTAGDQHMTRDVTYGERQSANLRLGFGDS